MMQGNHEITIKSTALVEVNGKDTVKLYCEADDGEECHVTIYITPATIEKGILKKQLSMVGFDLAKGHHFDDFNEKPELWIDKRIPVLVSEYQGRPKVELAMNRQTPKGKLAGIEQQMLSATEQEDLPF